MKLLTIHSHFLNALIRNVNDDTVNIRSLLQQHGIPVTALNEPRQRVSVGKLTAFTLSLCQEMGDLIFGYGKVSYHISATDGPRMMLHSMISAATLGEALQIFCEFTTNFHPLVQTQHTQMNGQHSYAFTIREDDLIDNPFINEIHTWFLLKTSCWMTKKNLQFTRVNFSFSPPSHAKEYPLLFGDCPFFFNQDKTSVIIPDEVLKTSIQVSNQDVNDMIEHNWLPLFIRHEKQESYTLQVKRLLKHDLQQMPSFPSLAETLNIHPQTLRRKLAKEGEVFTDLKNTVKFEEALQRLKHSSLSIEEIAYETGFSESSTFIRSFKKWSGETPYRYRKQQENQ